MAMNGLLKHPDCCGGTGNEDTVAMFDTSVDPAAIAQMCVFPISLAAYIPHWLTMIRNKSSEDVSLAAQVIWTFGSVLALVYPISMFLNNGVGLPIVMTASLNLVCAICTTILIAAYRRDEPMVELIEAAAGEAITNNHTSEQVLETISSLPSSEARRATSTGLAISDDTPAA